MFNHCSGSSQVGGSQIFKPSIAHHQEDHRTTRAIACRSLYVAPWVGALARQGHIAVARPGLDDGGSGDADHPHAEGRAHVDLRGRPHRVVGAPPPGGKRVTEPGRSRIDARRVDYDVLT